jgi:hypothetical protein
VPQLWHIFREIITVVNSGNYVRKIKLPPERWCQYYVRGNDLVYTSHLVLSDSEIQEDMMGWTCS